MKIQFTSVVAMAQDRAIGLNGTMPWHLPEDLKCFRRLTTGHPVLMGRKTYDSIGKKPLPNRQNIILTRDENFQAPGCIVIHSLDQIEQIELMDTEIMVIGGAQVYETLLPYTTRIWVSLIEGDFQADTYFPSFEEFFLTRRFCTQYEGFALWEYTR